MNSLIWSQRYQGIFLPDIKKRLGWGENCVGESRIAHDSASFAFNASLFGVCSVFHWRC